MEADADLCRDLPGPNTYAYLLTPPTKAMTADAKKRLEAIE
jgi:transcription-repair coupling factor (superfamily II helicase)